MSDEINELKIILTAIKGEIAVGEERLEGKLEQTEFQKETRALEQKIYTAIKKVDDRVTSLYIKVAGLSAAAGGISSLFVKLIS